jgi:hypothetical protein
MIVGEVGFGDRGVGGEVGSVVVVVVVVVVDGGDVEDYGTWFATTGDSSTPRWSDSWRFGNCCCWVCSEELNKWESAG